MEGKTSILSGCEFKMGASGEAEQKGNYEEESIDEGNGEASRKSYTENNCIDDDNQSLKMETKHIIEDYKNNDFCCLPEDKYTNEPNSIFIKEEVEWDEIKKMEGKTSILSGCEFKMGASGEAEQKGNYEEESIDENRLMCLKSHIKKQDQNLRADVTLDKPILNRRAYRKGSSLSVQKEVRGKEITQSSLSFVVNNESIMEFECKICGIVFESRNRFYRHFRNNLKCLEHNGEAVSGNYSCKLCDKSYKSEEKFKLHCTKHQVGYPCKICGKVLATLASMKYHLKHMPCLKKNSLKVPSVNKCTDCGRSFKRRDHMLAHINRMHTKNEEKYVCAVCGKIFRLRLYLQKHINEVHTNIEATCVVCKKTFLNKYKMQQHQNKQHSKNEECKCNYCPSTFSLNSRLLDHMQRCHLPPGFKCNLCTDTFQTDTRLKTHMRNMHLVDNRQSYLCFVCGKSLYNKEKLGHHLLIHSGEKPHICEVCGKRFRTTTNLSQHARIHSDLRPFECLKCKKAFRIKHHLAQHMAVHGMVSLPKYGTRVK